MSSRRVPRCCFTLVSTKLLRSPLRAAEAPAPDEAGLTPGHLPTPQQHSGLASGPPGTWLLPGSWWAVGAGMGEAPSRSLVCPESSFVSLPSLNNLSDSVTQRDSSFQKEARKLKSQEGTRGAGDRAGGGAGAR